jgi:signal peptidase
MKKLGNWLSNIILVLAILLLLVVLAVPLFFSGRVAVVLSSSMEPNMPLGALVVTMPVAPEEIKVGDIITFTPYWDPDVTMSHRVVEILTEGRFAFRTKGDANENVDPWVVPAEEAKGRVIFTVPYLGNLVNAVVGYVQTWLGLMVLVVLPSLFIVGSTVRSVLYPPSRRQKRLDLLRKRQRRWKRPLVFTR